MTNAHGVAGVSSGPLWEGRPGPSGTKYTQHAGCYSPFEPPSNQQLRKRLSAEPVFTAPAGVGAPLTRDGVRAPEDETVDSSPDDLRCDGDESDRRQAHSTSAGAPTTEAEDEGCREIKKWRGADEKALSETEGALTKDATRNNETGAEAGAGSVFPERDSSNFGAVRTSAGAREPTREATEPAGGGRAEKVAMKKPGLWELKAELSRIVQALSDAEHERDWEKLRVEEAETRLDEAVSRLQALRGNGLTGASIGVKV